MGRHSVSYIAAQQGLCTESTTVSAARYVGRVGALALAMGVGAAVAGGAGVANAEGPTSDPSGGTSTSDGGGALGALGAKVRKALSDVGGAQAGHLFGHRPTTDTADTTDAPSPFGLITKAPNRIATLVDNGTTDTGPTTSTGLRSLPNFGSHAIAKPSANSTPPSVDPAPFVRHLADTFTSLRNTPEGAVTPQVETVQQQSLTTTSPSLTSFLSPVQTISAPHIASPVSTLIMVLGYAPSAGLGGLPLTPVSPTPLVLGALQLLRREYDPAAYNQINGMTQALAAGSAASTANPSNETGTPTPGEQVPTPYGDVGKWMLQSDGQISTYGGQPSADGRQQLEPVNVIIVDPNSSSPEESQAKLDRAMTSSGFPAQPVHSGGFSALLGGQPYTQKPAGLLEGYSDNLFILPNDHGRIFGPETVATPSGTEYVYSGAFSTEQLGTFMGLPTHTYVSSNMARDALALRLILSGQAKFGGFVPLQNAVDTPGQTTGDHDGYAVVLILN